MSMVVRGVMASAVLALAGCGSSSGNTSCAPRVPTDDSVPGKLADWCQVELSNGEVAPLAGDVVPFTLTTPLYSDGAIKRPPNGFMTYAGASVP